MRIWIGALSLLLVLVVIAVLAKNQVGIVGVKTPAKPVSGSAEPGLPTTAQTPAQYKKALDAALQTARPIERAEQ